MAEETETKTKSNNDEIPTMKNGLLPLLGVFVAAVILLVAILSSRRVVVGDSTIIRNIPYQAYAISVSTIAIGLSALALIFSNFSAIFVAVVKYFLFGWCFVGAVLLTYSDKYPFPVTGNGYFALWLMALFSYVSMSGGAGVSFVKKNLEKAGNPSILALFFFALVVMISCLPYRKTQYNDEAVYCLVIAVISMAFSLVLAFLHYFDKEKSLITYFLMSLLCALWIVTAGIVTFRGPFTFTGNGYFGSWGCTICCGLAARDANIAQCAECAEYDKAPKEEDKGEVNEEVKEEEEA